MQSPGVAGVLAVGSEREALRVVEIQEVPHANETSDMGLGLLAVARSRTVGACRREIVGKALVVGKWCRLAGETVSSGCRERGCHRSRRLCCFRGFGIGDGEATGGEDGGNMKKKGRVLFFC